MIDIGPLIDKAATAAADDWRVSAGMVAAGVLLGGIEWWRRRRKSRHEAADKPTGDTAGCGGDCDRCAGGHDK